VPVPAIAAAGLLVVGLGSWLALGKKNEPAAVTASRMIATGVGVRDSLTLSDGTKVVLGPLSSVKVHAGYALAGREVEVRGDAYFEVVHDSSKPFTVYAGNATIRDIGTKFAVVSNDSGDVGVSVKEGSVSLAQGKSPEAATVLKAGDHGTLDRGGKVVTRHSAATDEDLAWLNGRLVFREAPLSEVASSMRRWYGINLQVADPSLANRHITATFSGESPVRVLEVLRLALGADIERHGDTAVVRSVKGKAR
jgi:transmembrane sensor